MTWFGFVALAILALAFYGNYNQIKSVRGVSSINGTPVHPKTKRVMVRGLYTGVAINLFFLLGILFVGTGTLF